jgi:hypothetical protein
MNRVGAPHVRPRMNRVGAPHVRPRMNRVGAPRVRRCIMSHVRAPRAAAIRCTPSGSLR